MNAIFPTTSLQVIKGLLLSHHLFDAAEHLIRNPRPSVAATQSNWFANIWPKKVILRKGDQVFHEVLVKDLFRTESYDQALFQHFTFHYNLPASTIQKQITTDGLDYAEMRQNLDVIQATESALSRWLRSFKRSSTPLAAEVIGNEELRNVIWDYSATQRLEHYALDEAGARDLNRELLVNDGGTLMHCECCYGEFAIEDFSYCHSGQHAFCRDCVSGQVNELVRLLIS